MTSDTGHSAPCSAVKDARSAAEHAPGAEDVLHPLRALCDAQGCRYRIIPHERPILAARDAAGLFDLTLAAPVYILERTDGDGLVAAVLSMSRGRPDMAMLTAQLGKAEQGMPGKGLTILRMASAAALRAAGLKPGCVPLVGLSMPCIFDDRLLEYDVIYGGTGHPLHTLEIASDDARRLHNVIGALS